MSEDLKLGQIIGADQDVERDATHVAIIAVTAQVVLLPGNRVNARGLPSAPHVGIVDPFLADVVRPGQRFWLWLFPGTVTGMRHHWAHPAFPGTLPTAEPKLDTDAAFSEQWLRRYAAKRNSYDEPEAAFNRLIDGLKSGQLFFHGSDLRGLYELDDADELKRHAERYLGIRVEWGKFTFSCSC